MTKITRQTEEIKLNAENPKEVLDREDFQKRRLLELATEQKNIDVLKSLLEVKVKVNYKLYHYSHLVT